MAIYFLKIGSVLGMKWFVNTKEFKDLNVGFAFDEGVPSAGEVYTMFLDEKVPWWVEIIAKGNSGHGR